MKVAVLVGIGIAFVAVIVVMVVVTVFGAVSLGVDLDVLTVRSNAVPELSHD